MPAFARRVLLIAFGGATLLVSACGVGDPTGGITSRVGQARSAAAVASLQQALITASATAADGGSAQGTALAAELQSRDPSHTYTAQPPTGPGLIEVAGGGGGPLLLVGYAEREGGQPGYVAAWQSGTTTRWYAGIQPPGYTSAEPVGAGWAQAAPTAGAIPASAPPQ